MSKTKIFVVSLPRTGTTSASAFFLKNGFRVAHTAYTQASFSQAQVIADVPVFSDYRELSLLFPGSKYVYLRRPLGQWIPSMRSLLLRVRRKLAENKKAFNPLLTRSYRRVFGGLFDEPAIDDSCYETVYNRHYSSLQQFVEDDKVDFLEVDIGAVDVAQQLANFVGISSPLAQLEHLNQRGQIAGWDRLEHDLKIGANVRGSNGRKYFDYNY